ncbi:DUF881 domain-containing protein [Jannaschia sp. R86511]|uniref:DUF881 domain-containing protein n=1 Tax=Jannaschia sp. R86511 TaxID=3093853 RepID=UPI0036D31E4B
MPRSVFSSSSLLTDIMQRPLDPGYEAAARRRAAPPGPEGDGGSPRRRRVGRRWDVTTSVVVAGVVLGLVAGAAVAQLRSGPLQAQDRAVLEAEIERRTALADEVAEANAELRLQIEADQAAAIGEGATTLLADTERLAVVTGAVPVVGDGVVVVLDDAPSDGVEEPSQIADDGRVRDVDVQTVVNGLWSAGAEGVAVNHQRLTSLSTIRHAGDAIVVDLRQLARPYTITAVGDPGTLEDEARTGSAGQWAAFLRDSYGISVSVEVAEDLELPAASRLTLRHAQGVDGPVGEDAPQTPPEEAGQT